MGLSHSPTIVTDHLMFCLDPANSRSYPAAGSWTDLKNGYTGTFINMNSSNFSNDYGGVFNFDGTNESINFGNIGSMPDDGCISFWMYSTSVENYRNPLHTSYGLSDGNAGVRFEQYDNYNNYAFGIVKGNDSGSFDGLVYTTSDIGGLLSENTWYNMAATWSKSNNRMTGYMNGVKISSMTTNPLRWATNFGTFHVGVGYNSTRHYSGKIANVSCYSKELSADEIRQNYNATKGRFQ